MSNNTIIYYYDKPLSLKIFLSLIFCLISLLTIIGNGLVVAAIVGEKKLRVKENFLILSLAITDLLVGCLVMPIAAVYEINVNWMFGSGLCRVWHTTDVLCCVSSILHLLAIAINRLLFLTRIDYNKNIHYVFITAVWVFALFISTLPLIGWQDNQFNHRISHQKRCAVSLNRSYLLFSALTIYFIPTVLILLSYSILYIRIRARIRIKEKRKEKLRQIEKRQTNKTIEEPNAIENESSSGMQQSSASGQTIISVESKQRSKSERKLAKSVTLITTVFVLCWSPFFISLVISLMIGKTYPLSLRFSEWLGYSNSMFNVLIYSIFAPKFRDAVIKIIRKCVSLFTYSRIKF